MMTESLWYCVKAVSTALSDSGGISRTKLDHLATSIRQMGNHQRASLEQDIQTIVQGLTELERRLRPEHAEVHAEQHR